MKKPTFGQKTWTERSRDWEGQGERQCRFTSILWLTGLKKTETWRRPFRGDRSDIAGARTELMHRPTCVFTLREVGKPNPSLLQRDFKVIQRCREPIPTPLEKGFLASPQPIEYFSSHFSRGGPNQVCFSKSEKLLSNAEMIHRIRRDFLHIHSHLSALRNSQNCDLMRMGKIEMCSRFEAGEF